MKWSAPDAVLVLSACLPEVCEDLPVGIPNLLEC